MGRQDEFISKSSNPAKYFLEWKSDDKCFSFYDKEKMANFPVKLPFTFLVLKQMHTVRGWHEHSGSGIYANDVEKIGEQELTVKSFKGGLIAKGIYRDIKEEIVKSGGAYCKSLYIMSTRGELLNIQLKGAPGFEWGEFTQKTKDRLGKEWVTVTGFKEDKKGKVTYSMPVFEYGDKITDEQGFKADAKYDEVEAYVKGSAVIVSEPSQTTFTEEENDDLPF